MPLFQRLLPFGDAELLEKSPDQLAQALAEGDAVAVDDVEDALAHFPAHHAARHLADRVVGLDPAGPAAVRDRAAEQGLELPIRYVLDFPLK